jgi:hypothetical protein
MFKEHSQVGSASTQEHVLNPTTDEEHVADLLGTKQTLALAGCSLGA